MQDQSKPMPRRNRVYKSLHKPLTYLGVERTLFFFIAVAAVGAFNLFNSLLAGIIVLLADSRSAHGWPTLILHSSGSWLDPRNTRCASTPTNKLFPMWRCADVPY
ncbi:hypothetical protein [Terriglobus aquaticus]|uniref:Uncharacterized protein n=1 Tax=Terriglobus aquaticus TaxID=940139 RepID=A0ABW9KK76_9BACT|nr:hypothetical protein [Terriglobus aquaticus]